MIASTLLGMHPPRLSSQLLVRSGELFGIAEGTTRTAVSRMVSAGELEADGSAYRLAGPLLARQARQDASRFARRRRWDGMWEMAVVDGGRRSAGARTEIREAMRRLKLAELREGVWLRPDNLLPGRAREDRAIVDTQCRTMRGEPHGDAKALAAELWDLAAWTKEARDLRRGLDRYLPRLEQGDTIVLRDGFVLSAAVLVICWPIRCCRPSCCRPVGWATSCGSVTSAMTPRSRRCGAAGSVPSGTSTPVEKNAYDKVSRIVSPGAESVPNRCLADKHADFFHRSFDASVVGARTTGVEEQQLLVQRLHPDHLVARRSGPLERHAVDGP